MPRRNKNYCVNPEEVAEKLTEEQRWKYDKLIADFLKSEETLLTLTGLNNVQRKYLHTRFRDQPIKTISYGPKSNRTLKISKKDGDKKKEVCNETHKLVLPHVSQIYLKKEERNLEAQLKTLSYNNDQIPATVKMNVKRIDPYFIPLGPKLVPRRPNQISEAMQRDKIELPIFKYKNTITTWARQYPVFIINGETGSGKTTQVPQYILEDAQRRKKPCRILVTQPRRVAAVSIASRVAEERGEPLGDAVGYQIKMENRMRKTSNLIYATSGVLLRSIIGNDASSVLTRITHLIIDEIHERDRFTDFILISVKEYLKYNKNLCVILMSATMDIELLSKYFGGCPVLNVPGQSFEVKIFHLEDILYHSGYVSDLMMKYLRSMEDFPMQNSMQYSAPRVTGNVDQNGLDSNKSAITQLDEKQQEMLDVALEQWDDEISKNEKDYEIIFMNLRMLIEDEHVSVDAAHSKTGLTPLMAACKANTSLYVEYLMRHNANIYQRDNQGLSAIDYANMHTDDTCSRLLETEYMNLHPSQLTTEDEEKQKLLKAYQKSFDDENEVDHCLIFALLEKLCRETPQGAIMVFLPGYSDIIQQQDLIRSTFPIGTYHICILHGQMDSRDQVDALKIYAERKIILSTNIGQTSITIPDLMYIIDAGKVKQNVFDSISESTQLKPIWISQADANQRSGRAGRTQNGVCYRLYSRAKFQFMTKFSLPEFMRISLTELCLFAKTLDSSLSVKDYLQRALNPPGPVRIENAIKRLKLLKVFNEDESVTDLGKLLVELPVDVNLGICLIYGIFFKCIDPVLTIAAFHSVKDPFILPTDRSQQGQSSFQRKSFAGDQFSDQFGILMLYRAYSTARNNYSRRRDFCRKYFLSESAMECFFSTRRQLFELISQRFLLGNWASGYNDDWNMVKLCLVAGFYPNIAIVNRKRNTLMGTANASLQIQRTSALCAPGAKYIKEFVQKIPHDYVIFFEKTRIGQTTCAINMNSAVPGVFIALQCGRYCDVEELNSEENSEYSECDDEEDSNQENKVQNDKKEDKHLASTEQELALQIKKALEMLSISEKTQQEAFRKVFISLDKWITFEMSAADAKPFILMRTLIQALFNKFLQTGHTPQTIMGVTMLQKFLNTLGKL